MAFGYCNKPKHSLPSSCPWNRIREFTCKLKKKLGTKHFNTFQNVWGEVYEVDDSVLSYLDAFEGYPKFYDRILIPMTMENGQKLSAFAFFFRDHKPEMLQLPYHEDYNSYGSHGMPYVERSNTRSTRQEADFVISELRVKKE